MAKSSSFFGLRRGSTKAHTFSVYHGKQVTKDRVTDISNPQTTKQMQQRVRMPLVAAARSDIAGIINHSFQGVDYGWKSKAHFSKLNLANLEVASFGSKGIRTTGIANYKVSEGSLIAPQVDFDEESLEQFRVIFPASDAGMTVPKDLNEFISLLLNANPNLQEGDQLTFLYAYVDVKNTTVYVKNKTRYGVAQPVWQYFRLVLSQDAEQNKDITFEGELDTNNSYGIRFKRASSLIFSPTKSSAANLYGLFDTADEDWIPVMFTCILSRYSDENKVWQRSSNTMTVCTNFDNQSELKDRQVTEAMAIASYLTGSDASSDYYLNEG